MRSVFRRTHLHVYRLSITREGLRRLIIPFGGCFHRMGILHAEKGELLLQGICSADCLQLMNARFPNLGRRSVIFLDGDRSICLSHLPFAFINAIFQLARNRHSAGISISKSHGLQTVYLYPLRHIHRESSRPGAQRQTHLAFMTLAADVRNHGRNREIKEAGDAHEVVLLRFCNLQWDFHLKGSVLAGHGGICLYQLIGRTGTPPPHLVSAGHLISYLGSLHRHSGIGLGCSLHHNGITPGISLVHLREGNLEGRTLVFLYSEIFCCRTIHGDRKHSRLSLLRQFEIHRSRTIFIGRSLLLSHLLPVGVSQDKLQLLALARHAGIQALLHDEGDGSGMHLLSWAIDAAVGKQLICCLVIFLLEIAVTAEIDVFGWRILICRSGNQHLSIHILEVSLTIAVSSQAGMNQSLMLARLHIIILFIEFNLSPGSRLAIGSIHHYIAMLIIRQLLDHHRQIAHIEEFALRSDTVIVRSNLHQIGTQRQIATDFDGILHLFIIRTTVVVPAVILLMQLRSLLQEHLIGSLILRIIIIICRDIKTGNAELQVLEIAHIQMHPRLLSWTQYLRHILHLEHRFGESLLRVSQFVHSRPSAPAAQRIVDIVELILRFGIGRTLHEAVVLHGKFACLRNILINVDERVDSMEILRLLHLSHVVLTVFFNELIGTETCRSPIAHLIIIGVQLQIRLLAVCLESDEMQQIVVEGTSIHALQCQWNILCRCMSSKKFRLFQGLFEELLAFLFVHITVHLTQHGISHRLQCRVVHLQHLCFHPLYVRRQRVSRNLIPECHLSYLSRQQLPVIFGSRSLGDDFLHHRDFALRLVLLSIDFSLLPQVVVCLSRYLHRSKEGYQK